MDIKVKASKLNGELTIPTSKSHTLRSILFASLANGNSIIHNYLISPDTTAMINACSLIGAKIEIKDRSLYIKGTSGKVNTPENIIDSGNSGQVLRFIAAFSALNSSGYTVLTGDQSIRTNRPIQPLISALNQLNVFAVSSKNDGYAPIIIKGPIKPGVAHLDGQDSQPVSGLLMACAFADGKSEIFVENPGEKPWIDLTLSWFDKFNIKYQNNNYTHYVVEGHASYEGFEYTVPGDFSSLAFPIVSALITNSEITVHNVDMNDVQGDKAIIYALQKMGAIFEFNERNKTISVKKSGKLHGVSLDINNMIDAITILAVVACFAEGETHISGAAIARKKESNRLDAIACELTKMGAKIKVLDDGLIIQPQALSGTTVESYHDHRVAMSLIVAGLAASGETLVEGTDCIQKSFPYFSSTLNKIGAKVAEFN